MVRVLWLIAGGSIDRELFLAQATGQADYQQRGSGAATGCAYRWRRSSANGEKGGLVTAEVLIDVNDGKYAR